MTGPTRLIHDMSNNTDDRAGDVLAQLEQRRAGQAQAEATARQQAVAAYAAAIRSQCDDGVEAPAVEQLDAALRALDLTVDDLRHDANVVAGILRDRESDPAEAVAVLERASRERDRLLDEARELRARADEIETAAQQEHAAAEREAQAVQQAHAQADERLRIMVDRLAQRGVTIDAELAAVLQRPAEPERPARHLHEVRAKVAVHVDGRSRQAGEVFIWNCADEELRERADVLELAQQDPAPTPFDGPDPTPRGKGDDDLVDLRDWPHTSAGFAARERALAEQRDTAEAKAAVGEGAPQ